MHGVEQRLNRPVKTPRAKSPLPVHHMKTVIKDGHILFMPTRAGSDNYDRTFTKVFIRPGLDPAAWRDRSN